MCTLKQSGNISGNLTSLTSDMPFLTSKYNVIQSNNHLHFQVRWIEWTVQRIWNILVWRICLSRSLLRFVRFLKTNPSTRKRSKFFTLLLAWLVRHVIGWSYRLPNRHGSPKNDDDLWRNHKISIFYGLCDPNNQT